MAKGRKRFIILRAALVTLLILVGATGAFCLWLSGHYKHVLMERLPAMVMRSSDSIYHISFSDIKVSLLNHSVTVTNVKLWADTNQVNRLRQMNRYSPNTVSTVSAPLVVAYGIDWGNIFSKRTIDCRNLVVHDPVWYMKTVKQHPDLSMVAEKEGLSFVHRFAVSEFDIVKPNFTYDYTGDKNSYIFYLKGGSATLHDWAVDKDIAKDTSTLLYAQKGDIKPDSIIFKKDGQVYRMNAPAADFVTTDENVTIKNVSIRHMTDADIETGRLMEIYNLAFPSIKIESFNWKRLLHTDELVSPAIYASNPLIDIHFIRDDAPSAHSRVGRFPNQLIRDAIKTNIGNVHIVNGTIKYNEPVKNSDTAFVIRFDAINGTLKNITNTDDGLRQNNRCIIDLKGRYMNKSPVSATFDLSLTDPKGRFKVDGYVNNLNGDDVSTQAAVFTLAKVTSFQLTHMDVHIEGDETYCRGDFAMLYHDLKISLFKFKSDDRKNKTGPFAFVADATILYPENPMPGKNVRKTTAELPRDPNHGFIYLIWQAMYMGAQKTAVRDDQIIALAGGKTDDEQRPKKGFFQRIFGKKK